MEFSSENVKESTSILVASTVSLADTIVLPHCYGEVFLPCEGFLEKIRPFITLLLVRAQKFHSLCQNQSTVAKRAETTVSLQVACELVSK